MVSKDKLTPYEKNEIIENDINTSQILSTFFQCIVSNLKIAEASVR